MSTFPAAAHAPVEGAVGSSIQPLPELLRRKIRRQSWSKAVAGGRYPLTPFRVAYTQGDLWNRNTGGCGQANPSAERRMPGLKQRPMVQTCDADPRRPYYCGGGQHDVVPNELYQRYRAERSLPLVRRAQPPLP